MHWTYLVIKHKFYMWVIAAWNCASNGPIALNPESTRRWEWSIGGMVSGSDTKKRFRGNYPSAASSIITAYATLGTNSVLHYEEPTTNYLSYGMENSSLKMSYKIYTEYKYLTFSLF